ncbi:hypothetical protein EJ04DRAFT_539208 [Polyplosphaeria fusca]|uniref:Uncharacterized protein n=1 Tax=Polyplosphaeria fusca TaxID=682080 RepID=A0A9P4QIJ3_9PLEO|nr:hypothetical protein EJ04DRAFT_539208 [Polyplosphaeria fusca]
MFFTISCSVLLSGVRLRREASSQCHDKDFLPMWSPVLEAVADTCRMDRFDGSFATLNSYKGTPNPHIDEAWDCVLMANGGMISIDEETLHKVNASNEFSGKLPSDMGGGYMASVEVLRQLHCLNVLRQATYEDYYKDKAEPWEEADTGVLTYVWVKDHPAPSPDFNVQHKCRNIESILDWVEERQIHTKEGHRIERQPGQKELEPPP